MLGIWLGFADYRRTSNCVDVVSTPSVVEFGWRTRDLRRFGDHMFYIVRAQLSNWTSTVPRHMLQYDRNKQQQFRVIRIHERIYAWLYKDTDVYSFCSFSNIIFSNLMSENSMDQNIFPRCWVAVLCVLSLTKKRNITIFVYYSLL